MALSLLEDMRDDGLRPDCVSYNTVLSACERDAQWEEAALLLHAMRDAHAAGEGAPPDAVSYNCAIAACRRARGSRAAARRAVLLRREMVRSGLRPNVVACTNATVRLGGPAAAELATYCRPEAPLRWRSAASWAPDQSRAVAAWECPAVPPWSPSEAPHQAPVPLRAATQAPTSWQRASLWGGGAHRWLSTADCARAVRARCDIHGTESHAHAHTHAHTHAQLTTRHTCYTYTPRLWPRARHASRRSGPRHLRVQRRALRVRRRRAVAAGGAHPRVDGPRRQRRGARHEARRRLLHQHGARVRRGGGARAG